MNDASPTALAGPPRTSSLRFSRAACIAAVIFGAALAGTARAVSAPAGLAGAIAGAFALNKVLWLCLGIAVWHVLRERAIPLGSRDRVVAAPALALAGTSAGVWAWIGLALALLSWLRGLPRGALRTGLLIALAAATHEVAIDILGELAGDALLGRGGARGLRRPLGDERTECIEAQGARRRAQGLRRKNQGAGRKGTDGLAELRARFARVAIVSESAKKLRAAATK